MAVVRYERSPETREFHAKLLLAWQDILQIVASSDEEFGIGITTDKYMEAGRMTLNGEVFYLINPLKAVPDWLKKQSAESIVLALWTLACHEVTHYYVHDHNEWFAITCNDIEKDSSEVILRCIKKIAKRLL
jgi:hypothetical protein